MPPLAWPMAKTTWRWATRQVSRVVGGFVVGGKPGREVATFDDELVSLRRVVLVVFPAVATTMGGFPVVIEARATPPATRMATRGTIATRRRRRRRCLARRRTTSSSASGERAMAGRCSGEGMRNLLIVAEQAT